MTATAQNLAASTTSSTIKKPRILVVDDEVAMVRSLELLLRPLGDVIKAYSVPEAEEVLDQGIDCIVTDVCMPEATGIELLQRVKKSRPDTPVIVMTAYSSVPEAVETMRMGAFEYIMKPFENRDLLASVKRAIERKGLIAGESAAVPSGWVCTSDAMKDFLLKAEKLAMGANPVLLVGERGVGKRRAALWMHEKRFPKAKKDKLLAIWSSHEADQFQLELDLSKVSSLFIEEVFSLSPAMQDRLFGLLQEGRIQIFAGTSSSPEMQQLPDFRKDLFEMLTMHPLRIPALKERAADFEALVNQLLGDIKKRMKLKELEVDAQAMSALKQHSFVGNVKELERVLERSAIEAKKALISVTDLRFESPDLSKQLPFSIPVEEGWGKLEYLSRSLERDLIERCLRKYPEASNSQIASILGTTRRILELRMKSYGIRETEHDQK